MALPTVNSPIWFDTTIPSTGKSVRFRPFLASDEKGLLMAAESQNGDAMMKAVMKLVTDCYEGLNIRELTGFDVEVLMLKLRAKSVGEIAEPAFSCSKCEHPNVVAINLEDVPLTKGPESDTIKLNDDISLKMKYPLMVEIINVIGKQEDQHSLLRLFIDQVITNEEVSTLRDATLQEQLNFIGSFNHSQMKLVQAYVDAQPKLTMDIDFTCEKCEHQTELKLEGLQNFFV